MLIRPMQCPPQRIPRPALPSAPRASEASPAPMTGQPPLTSDGGTTRSRRTQTRASSTRKKQATVESDAKEADAAESTTARAADAGHVGDEGSASSAEAPKAQTASTSAPADDAQGEADAGAKPAAKRTRRRSTRKPKDEQAAEAAPGKHASPRTDGIETIRLRGRAVRQSLIRSTEPGGAPPLKSDAAGHPLESEPCQTVITPGGPTTRPVALQAQRAMRRIPCAARAAR